MTDAKFLGKVSVDMNAHQIIASLGIEDIAGRLGVTTSAVREARRNNLFPAAWYAVLDEMGRTRGVEIPRELFNWRAAS